MNYGKRHTQKKKKNNKQTTTQVTNVIVKAIVTPSSYGLS